MINRAIGILRGRFNNALSHAPPPPKPAAEMNIIEITEYNKIPSKYELRLTKDEFHALDKKSSNCSG